MLEQTVEYRYRLIVPEERMAAIWAVKDCFVSDAILHHQMWGNCSKREEDWNYAFILILKSSGRWGLKLYISHIEIFPFPLQPAEPIVKTLTILWLTMPRTCLVLRNTSIYHVGVGNKPIGDWYTSIIFAREPGAGTGPGFRAIHSRRRAGSGHGWLLATHKLIAITALWVDI